MGNSFTFISSWLDVLEPTLWKICKKENIRLTYTQFNKLILASENYIRELGITVDNVSLEDFHKFNDKCENGLFHLVYKAKNNEL